MEEYFKNALASSIVNTTSEKSVIDKVLGRKDVEVVKEIVKKKKLEREDLMELMYMLSSVEIKLLNYEEWDRYVMAKYFVWIRDFVALAESLMDYHEDMKRKQEEGKIHLSPRTQQIFDNNMRLIEHNVKFLVDLYFNLARSTQSLSATGFLELLKSKFELVYPAPQQQPESQKMVNFKWKR